MATLEPGEKREYDNLKQMQDDTAPGSRQQVKGVPSDAEYERRKRETARTGEGADKFQNAPPSDINRQ